MKTSELNLVDFTILKTLLLILSIINTYWKQNLFSGSGFLVAKNLLPTLLLYRRFKISLRKTVSTEIKFGSYF